MPPTKPKSKITEFHVLEDGLTLANQFGKAYVTMRGESFTITEKMISASLDRFGNSWLDLIDNPEAQLARFGGKIYLAPGPWPFAPVEPEPPTLYVRESNSVDRSPYVAPETFTVHYKTEGGHR